MSRYNEDIQFNDRDYFLKGKINKSNMHKSKASGC